MSSLTRGLRRCTIIALVAGTAALAAPTAALAAPAPTPAKAPVSALAVSPTEQSAHTEAFGQGCLQVLTLLFGPGGEIWQIAATNPAAVPSTLYAWLVANPAGPTVTQLCLSGE